MLAIPNYGHVLVALSGGPDSIALALLAIKSGARVTAAHVEHGIRGEHSVRDMAFVEDFCARLGIALHVARIDVPALAKRNGLGIETAAREERYRFLRDVKARVGADVIATAHHMDDQMETVLMHMFRGCGTRGLEGMRAQSGDIVRPLIGYTKAELIAYLDGQEQPYRLDETNQEKSNPRNALRNGAIPEIVSAYPQAVRAVARLARLVQLEGEYLDQEAGSLIQEEFCGFSVRKDAHEALVKRAISSIVPDFDGVNAAFEQQAVSLPGGWHARECDNRIYLTSPGACPLTETPLTLRTRAEGIQVRAEDWPSTPLADSMAQVFAQKALSGAVLRSRSADDFIRPLGMTGRKSISDYMQDKKIPLPLRDFWPLVAVGNEVLWVIGVGVSETSKVNAGVSCVKLTAQYIR